MWVKNTKLLAAMTSWASYTFVYIAIYWSETLERCYKSWMRSVWTTNTPTVSIHFSSTDSIETLLSKLVKCLIMCKEQYILIKKTGEYLASQIKESWRKSLRHFCWVLSTMLNRRIPVDKFLQTELSKLKKLNSTWNWKKNVDCFPDGHFTYTGSSVNFR